MSCSGHAKSINVRNDPAGTKIMGSSTPDHDDNPSQNCEGADTRVKTYFALLFASTDSL